MNTVYIIISYNKGDIAHLKQISTRISQKHDFEYNWINSASEFIPYAGEIIIYDAELDEQGNLLTTLPEGRTEPYTYSRMKIGDGVTLVSNLPFINDVITNDEIDEICSETLTTFLEDIACEEVSF